MDNNSNGFSFVSLFNVVMMNRIRSWTKTTLDLYKMTFQELVTE